jgi:hypothetical protein
MKRLVVVAISGLTAGACGFSSGLTSPTTTITMGDVHRAATGVSCPSPSPTQLPFAVFGTPHATGCGTASPPPQLNAVFKIHPDPASGIAPLGVDFGMCGSSDTDPTVTLHYHVDHGDGSPADGASNYCSFSYTYPNPGTYNATECVWDEVPAHAPGTCQTFTVTVMSAAPPCTVTFGFGCYTPGPGGNAFATLTTGGPAVCGNPLTVNAFVNGAEIGSASTVCPPGATGCQINFPNFPQPAPPTTPVLLKGGNATGSILINPNQC